MWLIRQITFPAWRQHGVRTALTVLGVTLGVAAIVATRTVTASLFFALERALDATAGPAALHVTNDAAGVAEQLVDAVRSVPGVETATPLIEGFVMLPGTEGESLAIFGVDILADQGSLPRSAIELPDSVVFVSQPDSIALARPWAASRGYALGTRFEVLTARGIRPLVVRGFVDPVGPVTLFGGSAGLMDFPAAQRLIGKAGTVDRIDVQLAPGVPSDAVIAALEAEVAGRARIETTMVFGRRGREFLQSLRVMLALTSLIATAVAFFIVHHTATVAVVQRRRDLALLNALGVARRTLVTWLAVEVVLVAALAAAVGIVLGAVIARLSLASVTNAAAWWLPVGPTAPRLSMGTVALGVSVGLGTTLAATLPPVWALASGPIARFLHLASHHVHSDSPVAWKAGGGLTAIAVAAASLHFAPGELSYSYLLAYILVAISVALGGFALLSPLLARLLGRLMRALGNRLAGVSLLLAGSTVIRNPAGPLAVVTAILIGLCATVSDASLVASLKRSWLGWLERHYDADLVVSAGSAILPPFASPPIDEEIVDAVRALPGVREAQGLRAMRIVYRERPAVLEGVDRSTAPEALVDGDWDEISVAFWAGAGALVSDNLQRQTGVRRGDVVALPTPTGTRRLDVLAIVSNFHEADLGSIVVSRSVVAAAWNDHLVNRIRIWTTGGSTAVVRETIQRRFGRSHNLRTLTAGEFRAAAADVLGNAFGMTYALVFIAFGISFAGIVNFLLAAIADRRLEIRTLVAVGVPARQIAATFVAEGGVLGGIGVCVGIPAAAGVSILMIRYAVPMVNGWHLAYEFPLGMAFGVSAAAITLAMVAGLVPARLATRKPAEKVDVVE